MNNQSSKIWLIYSIPIFILFLGSLFQFLPKYSIISFLLGCFTSIISSIIAIVYAISRYESKTLESIEKMKEQKKKLISNENNNNNNNKTNDNQDIIEGEIEISPPGSYFPTGNWLAGTLKENVLVCKTINTSSEVHIIVLDECQIIPVKVRDRSSLWSRKNYILVTHHERNLIKNHKEFCMFFKSGKEMEEWYIYLRRASNVHSTDFQQRESAMKFYFNDLKLLLSQEVTDNATWFNLLTHRIFYNIHSDHYFLKLIRDKIMKKLEKIKKPSILKTIDVEEVNFGTNMPIFKNLKLVEATKDGFLVIDSDVDYRGGFTLKVKLVVLIEILLGRKLEITGSLRVTINKLSGRLKICCSPPPADRIWLGFYEAPKIDFKIDSFIHKHKIESLSRFIISKLEKEIIEIMVLPDMTDFPFPKFSTKEGKLRQIQFMKHEEVIEKINTDDIKPFIIQSQQTAPPVPKNKIDLKDDDLKLLVHEVEQNETNNDNGSQAPPLPHRNHLIIPRDSDPPTPGGAFERLKYKVYKDIVNLNSYENKPLPTPTISSRIYNRKDSRTLNYFKEKISHIFE